MVKGKRSKTECPVTAMEYLMKLRPDGFREIYDSCRFGSTEVYAPVRGEEFEELGGLRQGDQLRDGDVHIITKDIHLTVPEIKALPEFEFQSPQLMAFQLSSFLNRGERYIRMASHIDRKIIEYSINANSDIRNLNIDLVEGNVWEYPVEEDKSVYQIISFPTKKCHVEGLLKVAEDFYNDKGKRGEILKDLNARLEGFEESFLKGLHEDLQLSKSNGERWGGGDSVDFVVMGDKLTDRNFGQGKPPIYNYEAGVGG